MKFVTTRGLLPAGFGAAALPKSAFAHSGALVEMEMNEENIRHSR